MKVSKLSLFFFRLRNRFIKAYDTGFLPEKDGHSIFYQQVGNPKGIPVISFHGGPAGSSKPRQASGFDLKKYRVILFDQRGCGKSTFKDALFKNTIQDTIDDAKRLLEHLKIKRKVVATGGSYGSTCAVLFAETYPDLVEKIIVCSVFLARPKDYENMSSSAVLFYPDALSLFQKFANQEQKTVFDYFYDLIFSSKPSNQKKALRFYGAFEHQLGHKDVSFPKIEGLFDKRVLKMRIMMHYMKARFFLTDNQLVRDAKKIRRIPTVIFQNRLDFICPPYQAHQLHKALPHSFLYLVDDMGHGSDKMRYIQYLKNKE